ncbi:UNKNOWN [Stylonychia lemnae]|uniref:Uncharacterized protein n=1 Tax=Stylonychia lemnae TaxID=5949 RepID=A0A078A2U0_STYLE|nr:UNKNOWN [Stylonychia lemnae]|eukprot:CDW76147.1 UNKNOWN [Stylonychia lemnae]
MRKILNDQINSGRSAELEANQNCFDQTYFGDSFQIQQESLRNLQQEDDIDNLRGAKSKSYENKNINLEFGQDPLKNINENGLFTLDESQQISPINDQVPFEALENLNFEVQIKSLDKVRSQKEINETFIHIDQFENDESQLISIIGEQENGLDVSAIFSKPNLNDKSGFAADTSLILNHATGQFNDQNNNSFLLMSPHSQIIGHQRIPNDDQDPIDQNQVQFVIEEKNNEYQKDRQENQISAEVMKLIIKDLQATHQAEKDNLKLELGIFKKDELIEKDKIERELIKQQHLRQKLENQFRKLKDENRKLNEKVEIMRKVMLEFDLQNIEEQTQENRLLLIQETGGLQDYTSLEEQLKDLENQTVNLLLAREKGESPGRRQTQIGYYSKRRNNSESQQLRQIQNTEPLNQSMPNELKQIILERQMIKEDERKINLEMRRIAEEEIMRELRMAEDYYNQSEFQKTNKIFPVYNDQEIPKQGHYIDGEDDEQFQREEGQKYQYNAEGGQQNYQDKGFNQQDSNDQQYDQQVNNEEENVFKYGSMEYSQEQIQQEAENKVGNEQR